MCVFPNRVEVEEFIVLVFVEGGHVAGLLVPVAVVVVGHHGNPVQVPGDARHVVRHVDDLLTAGQSKGLDRYLYATAGFMKRVYSV